MQETVYDERFVDEQMRCLERHDYEVTRLTVQKKREIMDSALRQCGSHATRTTIANCVQNKLRCFAKRIQPWEKMGFLCMRRKYW